MRDGQALQSTLAGPSGLIIAKSGGLYIVDTYNNAIRMLLNGEVTTLAGGERNFNPEYDFGNDILGPELKDGTGGKAEFDFPQSITLDPSGNLYVSGGYGPSIRKVTQKGVVTTLKRGGGWDSDNLATLRGIAFHDDQIYFNSTYWMQIGTEYNFTLGTLSLLNNQITDLVSHKWDTSRDGGDDGFPPVTTDGLNFTTGMVIVDNVLYFCNTGESRIRKIYLN